MIIDNSYFQSKSTFIPSSIAQPSIGANTPTAVTQLANEIEERERELLVSFLGWAQYAELLDQFEDSSPFDWKPDALQKWKDLVDGVVYEGKKWNGLRYSIGNQKISLIAYYVFFYYLQSDFRQYTTTGMQVPEAENSTRQEPNGAQVKAWNAFVKMYGGQQYGRRYSFFSNWNGYGMRWGNWNGNEVTLFDYMQAHNDLYDNSFFSTQSMINIFNL